MLLSFTCCGSLNHHQLAQFAQWLFACSAWRYAILSKSLQWNHSASGDTSNSHPNVTSKITCLAHQNKNSTCHPFHSWNSLEFLTFHVEIHYELPTLSRASRRSCQIFQRRRWDKSHVFPSSKSPGCEGRRGRRGRKASFWEDWRSNWKVLLCFWNQWYRKGRNLSSSIWLNLVLLWESVNRLSKKHQEVISTSTSVKNWWQVNQIPLKKWSSHFPVHWMGLSFLLPSTPNWIFKKITATIWPMHDNSPISKAIFLQNLSD